MSRSRLLPLAIVVVPALLVAVPGLVDVYTDWLWFGETGYQSVFLRSLSAQGTLGTAALAIVLAWLLLNLRPAVHMATPDPFLKPGVHGPVAAFGLDTLSLGAAEAGLHEANESPAAVHSPTS